MPSWAKGTCLAHKVDQALRGVAGAEALDQMLDRHTGGPLQESAIHPLAGAPTDRQELAEIGESGDRVEERQSLAGQFEERGAYLGKRPDEILTAIHLPEESAAGRCRQAFWKLRRRGSIDFAVLSAAVALWTAPGGTVERARIVLGSVASSPVSADDAAEALVGQPLNPETIAQSATLARKVATPMDNTDFQAQWRSAMVQKYTEAALREAAGLPVECLAPKHG